MEQMEKCEKLSNRTIIIYGAGKQNLWMTYQMIDAAGFPIHYIVDRDKKKQGKSFWGTVIISPERLFELDQELDDYLLVISVRTAATIQEIQNSLSELRHAEIITFEQLVIQEKLNSKSIKLNQLQTHITDHCNLNCTRCSHFSPIAEEYYLDEEEFERSTKRLSELLHGELHEWQLAGGEPLLHPECYKFPYIIRKYFPKTDIILITNGSLLGRMDNRFFRSCRDNKVQVCVTIYPVHLDYKAIRQKLNEEEVDYLIGNTGVEDGTVKELWAYAFHPNGDCPGKVEFDKCFSRCFMLRGSKVYICAQGAYSDIVNQYFGTEMPQLEDNGVDLFEVSNGAELMHKLSRKILFCDYCNPLHRQPPIPFAISKREITEWVDPAALTEDEIKMYNSYSTTPEFTPPPPNYVNLIFLFILSNSRAAHRRVR